MTDQHHDPVENFIEQMGLIFQAEGGPRIAGRILGLLLVEGRALTLSEMAEQLQISKASASTNARLLASRGLLRLTAHTGDRQDYYELMPNPYQQMLETISAKLRKNAQQIEQAEELIPESHMDAKQRIRHFAEFYRSSADFIAEWTVNLKLPR